MKKNKNIGRGVLAFFILLGILAVLWRHRQDRLLESDHELLNNGLIVNVTSGGYTGGGVTFSVYLDEKKYENTMPFPWKCEDLILMSLSYFQKRKYQVVFQKGFPQNSKILLLKSQYEKYGLDIPEELKGLISELSECE